MPKSSKEKQEYANFLLQKGISYAQIQEELKNRYGSGMSNTTLQRMILETDRIKELEDKMKDISLELKMYKKMYYELLEAVKEKIKE
ncbi:hypothetical protein DSAG12_03379 [Promethearchaeum syntrophicum]|uniref:Transposase n=1 Tax=Promethearchaeum syntrophicum TaxID=2594042 RepID=A0A5B9DEM1_9ARCH|nr:hypothetical protein [Candidatus Prometheoarchaeum syntrophicum]QEE17542.1 hypothetical protein DSAG12_03379 [Candidatus Prometheoarchaeum syntrophicum]